MSSMRSDVKNLKREDEEFTKPTEDTDIILNVGGKKLHAVRYILKTASPVFNAMLKKSGFKEANAMEIDFPTENFRNMQLLLKHINPDAGFISAVTSERLLPLTDKYQIEGLQERCINCLFIDLNKKPDGRLLSLLSLTEQHGINNLKEECIKLLIQIPDNKLHSYINEAAPKHTVTWQSVGRIFQPRTQKIQACLALHRICSGRGYCNASRDNSYNNYLNDKCLSNFASQVLACKDQVISL